MLLILSGWCQSFQNLDAFLSVIHHTDGEGKNKEQPLIGRAETLKQWRRVLELGYIILKAQYVTIIAQSPSSYCSDPRLWCESPLCKNAQQEFPVLSAAARIQVTVINELYVCDLHAWSFYQCCLTEAAIKWSSSLPFPPRLSVSSLSV